MMGFAAELRVVHWALLLSIGLSVLLETPQLARAQNCLDVYNPSQVLRFDITMSSAADWDALRHSCPTGVCPLPHTLYPAFFSCGNQQFFVGIRRKNGPAEPSEENPQKVALKVEIGGFIPGQTFAGKSTLSLESGSFGSLVTEGLSWLLYKSAGVVASDAAWAKVYVNGAHAGLFINVEQVDKVFLPSHGLDNGGFLYKEEDQRTRELETNPFAFNWYPFDHPLAPPETTAPANWQEAAQTLVDMDALLTLAAAENFISNTEGVVGSMMNYWYYDWSILPNDDPGGKQPRLYFAWDLDVSMRTEQIELPIDGSGAGHLELGLIDEVSELGLPLPGPAFRSDYCAIYRALLDGPLALSATLLLVDSLEATIANGINADPYQQTGAASAEFDRIRDFLQTRTAFLWRQFHPADFDRDGDGDLRDMSSLMTCFMATSVNGCATDSCRSAFDFNNDCVVDGDDISSILLQLLGPGVSNGTCD